LIVLFVVRGGNGGIEAELREADVGSGGDQRQALLDKMEPDEPASADILVMVGA
jgi:hypothetical protein